MWIPEFKEVTKKALPPLTLRGIQIFHLSVQGTMLGIRVKTRRQKEQACSCNCGDEMKMCKFQNCTFLSAVMEELGDLVLVRNIFSLFSIFFFSFQSRQTPVSGPYAHCMKVKPNTIKSAKPQRIT